MNRSIIPFLLSLALCGFVHAQVETSSLPRWRANFAATTTDSSLYVGGGKFYGLVTDTVDIMDIATGTWTSAHLSEPRTRLAATTCGHEVFFAGGGTTDTSVSASATVDIYNELSGTWQATQLPFPMFAPGALSHNGKVYVAGSAGPPVTHALVQIFDTSTRTWTVQRLKTRARIHMNVDRDERWLVFGGGAGVSNAGHQVDIYDTVLDKWSHISAPLNILSLTVHRGVIRAVTCHSSLAGPVVREYDLVNQAWRTMAMREDRCAAEIASTGAFTVLANGVGYQSQLGIFPTADVYNHLTGTWELFRMTTLRDRITTKHEASGSLFFLGGYDELSNAGLEIDIFRPDADLSSVTCSPAAPNSTGQTATIEAAGLNSVEDDWFFLGMGRAPVGSLGMFVAGSIVGNPVTPPGSLGQFCLGGTIARLPETIGLLRNDGAYGALGAKIDLSLPGLPHSSIAPGTTWHFQGWYRDLNPSLTSNFTPAISVSFD